VELDTSQLDKFKNKKSYEPQGFKAFAVFLSDPYQDEIYY
jgi:hypothetical protein